MLSSSEKRRQRQQRPGASQPLPGSVQGEGFFVLLAEQKLHPPFARFAAVLTYIYLATMR